MDAWRAERPGLGFTRLVVGECGGSEGDAMSGFISSWDHELAADLYPVWMARNYMSGALLDVDELVTVVENVLRGGASMSLPSVTVVPRKGATT